MKSIKPGRGPSKQAAVGSAILALFGIFWCIGVAAMGGGFMAVFGLLFTGFAIYNAVYEFRNATSEDRYSIVDIVDEDEEPDPLNIAYGGKRSTGESRMPGNSVDFCPYCDKPVEGDFDFCPRCGKKLPD